MNYSIPSQYSLVNVTEDRYEEWLNCIFNGFGYDFPCSDDAVFNFIRSSFPSTCAIAITEGHSYVATGGAVDLELVMPGGNTVPIAGITGMTVDSTVRRQGLQRAMLSELHRRAVDSDIPVLGFPSPTQWPIYSRFGYGPAAWFDSVTIDPRLAGWRSDTRESALRIERVSGESARRLSKEIFIRQLPSRPGEVVPPETYWDRFLAPPNVCALDAMLDLADNDSGARRCVAVGRDGFASYRIKSQRFSDLVPRNILQVTDLLAVDQASAATLWKHVLNVDLVSEIRVPKLPVDSPLQWWVTDARRISALRRDGLWLRPLDVERLLKSRAWQGQDTLVIRIHDEEGYADGTYLLNVEFGKAECKKTLSEDVDLEMAVGTLGSLLLGGVPARTLATSGKIHAKNFDSAMRWDRIALPACAPFLSYSF